jgi:hypothetical protein
MKGRTLVLVIILLLPWDSRENPIWIPFINELQFTANGWRLEIHPVPDPTFAGCLLKAGADSAHFGMKGAGGDYAIVTQDSLDAPLPINETGDTLAFYGPNTHESPAGYLIFGVASECRIDAPSQGESIAWDQVRQCYYLDNSPTMGANNDTVNACGVLNVVASDTLGTRLSGVKVWFNPLSMGGFVTTDDSGRCALGDIARRVTLSFELTGFHADPCMMQIMPESTVTVSVTMRRLDAAAESPQLTVVSRARLAGNFPNPFNPETTFEIHLQRPEFVTLRVYTIAGIEAAVVVAAPFPAGVHRVRWRPEGMASGVYLGHLKAGSSTDTRKILLIR